MFNRLKSLSKKNGEQNAVFPINTRNINNNDLPNENIEQNNLKSKNQHSDEQNFDLKPTSLNICEKDLSKIANIIMNNSYFLQALTTSLEKVILETLESRYDLTPTDTLRQLINDKKNELERINSAVEDKTDKLETVSIKIEEALQNIAPQIQKMLADVAHKVLHNSGTN